jgi:hypothetical protein
MVDTLQSADPSKGLVERAKAIIVSPKTEWPVIAAEGDSVQTVFLKYVVPLAAIGPIASLIGGQVFGYGGFGFTIHMPLGFALATAITQYVLSLVGVFLIAWVANFLSPKFGGKDDFAAAFKWVAYAYTAAWVAGILGIIPALGMLTLLAALYGLYVLYLGATPVMVVPQDKSGSFTAVTIVAAIVVYFVVFTVAGSIAGLFAASPYSAAAIASSSGVGGAENVEVDLGDYGTLKVTDNGNGNQTVDIPGMGKVEMTQDGEMVKVEGEGFKATVQNTPAAE